MKSFYDDVGIGEGLRDVLKEQLERKRQIERDAIIAQHTIQNALSLIETEPMETVLKRVDITEAAFQSHEMRGQLPKPGTIAGAAVEVMQGAKAPLTVAEVSKRVQALFPGLAINPATVADALYKYMRDDRRPKNLHRVGPGKFFVGEMRPRLKLTGPQQKRATKATVAVAAETLDKAMRGKQGRSMTELMWVILSKAGGPLSVTEIKERLPKEYRNMTSGAYTGALYAARNKHRFKKIEKGLFIALPKTNGNGVHHGQKTAHSDRSGTTTPHAAGVS